MHGPFIDCPRCKKHTFGILSINKRSYSRRCSECWYPQRNDPPAIFQLPPLDKKVLYLDQFAISNMMKAINPATAAHKEGRVGPFWQKLFSKIDILCKKQLLICPDSDFHKYESVVSSFYDALKRMYEHLSHGVSFYDHETIRRFQITDQFRIWLGDAAAPNLDKQRLIRDDINVWQDLIHFSVRGGDQSRLIDELRLAREQVSTALLPLFQKWQTETSKTFPEWYEQEREVWANVLIRDYKRQWTLIIKSVLGIKPADPLEYSPGMGMITFHTLKNILKQKGLKPEELNGKLGEFLSSKEFKDAPFIRIGSMLFAALARKAAAGQKQPPNQGFVTDVSIVSTLLPYCDAMFIDDQFRSYMQEEPLKSQLDFGTLIFSQSNKENFLSYLDQIEQSASPEHMQKVVEVYGEDGIRSFDTMYTQDQKKHS